MSCVCIPDKYYTIILELHNIIDIQRLQTYIIDDKYTCSNINIIHQKLVPVPLA